jgi:hypothetical protein
VNFGVQPGLLQFYGLIYNTYYGPLVRALFMAISFTLRGEFMKKRRLSTRLALTAAAVIAIGTTMFAATGTASAATYKTDDAYCIIYTGQFGTTGLLHEVDGYNNSAYSDSIAFGFESAL